MGVHAIVKCGVEVTPGNDKVVDSVIFNMCSGKFCPSAALDLCMIGQDKCYTCKFEVMRPNVLKYRMRQAWQWLNSSVSDYIACLDYALAKTGFRSIRFNEAGDFADVSCIEKLSKIALAFPSIPIFGYTARGDLHKKGYFKNLPKNVVITGSGFMVHNTFGPYYKDTVGKVDCVGNCGGCNLCKERAGRIIYNPLH